MANNPETYLDKFLIKDVQDGAGNVYPTRRALRFLGGSAVADNPVLGTTDVTPASSLTPPIYVTSLETTPATASRQVIFCDGYSSQGDGGGGLFAWDASSTATPDGGTIIQVTGVVTGRWMRVYTGGALSVRWYGAKGDGTTDDHVAILACWAACVAQGVNQSHFPPGVYVSSVALNLPYNVGISGYGAEIYFETNASDGIIWASGSQQVAAISGICGLTITGGGTGGRGLTVSAIQGARVDSCGIIGFNKQGALFLDTILSEMRNTIVTDCGATTGGDNGGTGYAAVEVDSANVNGNAGGLGSTTFTWYDNNVTNNPAAPAGLRIDRTGPSTVTGGTSENSGVPIQISSKSESVNGAGHIVITGLDLELPSPVVDRFIDIGYGLTLGTNQNRCGGITISGCTIVCDSGGMDYAIKAKYTDGLRIDGNYIGPENSPGTTLGNIWLEGTTNTNLSLGYNKVTNPDPYVVINGVQDASAIAGYPWDQNRRTFSASVPPGVTVLANAFAPVVTILNVVAPPSGRVEVGGSLGPGGICGYTSMAVFISYVAHGAGWGGSVPLLDVQAAPTEGLQGNGLGAVVSGLTPGSAYDFAIMVAPLGGNYQTSGSPNALGGLLVRDLP